MSDFDLTFRLLRCGTIQRKGKDKLALIAIAVALAVPNVQAAVVAVFGQVITAINST